MLTRIDAGDHVPTLLLHACCAPCSSYCLSVLAEHFSVKVLYYNPNITEEAEFAKRAQELGRLVAELPTRYPVEVIVPEYRPEEFYEIAKGLEAEPERGKRCEACFRLRLSYTAREAARLKAEYFATHKSVPAETIFTELKKRDIFVRFWNKPRINNHLRITIGTDAEMDALVAALKEILAAFG